MNSVRKQARFAGLLYLLASLPVPFYLIYVPGKLIVPGDAVATANHVRAFGTLLRFGIASELISSIVFIFVVLALYRLLKRVNKKHALAMVILFLVSIPISLLNVLNDIAALILVSGADFLSVFDKRQLDALVYLFLRLHIQGFVVAAISGGFGYFLSRFLSFDRVSSPASWASYCLLQVSAMSRAPLPHSFCHSTRILSVSSRWFLRLGNCR